MRRRDVTLPECLAKWIAGTMPELGDVGRVRVLACEPLPFEWLPGDRSWIAGITLWSRVHLRERLCPIDPGNLSRVELLLHELVHVGQFRAQPVLFPLRYLWSMAWRGYENCWPERQARERAKVLVDRYAAERPCA